MRLLSKYCDEPAARAGGVVNVYFACGPVSLAAPVPGALDRPGRHELVCAGPGVLEGSSIGWYVLLGGGSGGGVHYAGRDHSDEEHRRPGIRN